jgi:hypothetical protein
LAAARAASKSSTAAVAPVATSAGTAASTPAPPTAASASLARGALDLATDVEQIFVSRGLNARLHLALEWCKTQGFESISELCEADEEAALVTALGIKPGKAKLLIKDLRRKSVLCTAQRQAVESSLSPSSVPRSRRCSHTVSPLQPAPSPTISFASPSPPALAAAPSGKNSLDLAPRPPLTALPPQPSRLTTLPAHLYQSGREAAQAGLLPNPPFPISTSSDEAAAAQKQTPAADRTMRSVSSDAKPMSAPYKVGRGLTTPAAPAGRPSGACSRRASIATGVPSRELCTPLSRGGSAPHPSSAPSCLTATGGGSAWAAKEDGPSSPESVASEPAASTVRPRLGVVSRLPLACCSGSSFRSLSPASPLACKSASGSAVGTPSRPDVTTATRAREARSNNAHCDDEEDWETGTPPSASGSNARSGTARSRPHSSLEPAMGLELETPPKATRSAGLRAMFGLGLGSPAYTGKVPRPVAALSALAEAPGGVDQPATLGLAVCEDAVVLVAGSPRVLRGTDKVQLQPAATPLTAGSWQELSAGSRCGASPCEPGLTGRTPGGEAGSAMRGGDGRPLVDVLLSPLQTCALAGATGRGAQSTVGCAEALLGADGVVRYELTLTRGHQRWAVLKRYREWRALRALLERSVPAVRRVPERFPPRRIHVFALCPAAPGGRHDPQLLNERAHLLAKWLDGVLRALPPTVDASFSELQGAPALE